MDEKAVYGIAASLGYSLKPEQKRSIWKLLSGMIRLFHCHQDLGYARRGVKNKSMILVVSPLKALRRVAKRRISNSQEALFLSTDGKLC